MVISTKEKALENIKFEELRRKEAFRAILLDSTQCHLRHMLTVDARYVTLRSAGICGC